MKGEYYSVYTGGHWRVVNTCMGEPGAGQLKHLTGKTAQARCDRATILQAAGEISPADLMAIREKLALSRREFAASLCIAVRTLEDYEQAKRRISPVVYKLAKKIGG